MQHRQIADNRAMSCFDLFCCARLGAAPAVFQPRGGPSTPKSWHHKKSGAEHSIQRHSSSPTGLSGGCAKPIFDHAHERSAKRQGERGLILCPLSSNLPYRSRRVELRLQQRRKTEEAGFELVWGFSCQVVVFGCWRFFVRSGKGRSSSRRLRSGSRSARKGSRDRNA